MDREKYGEIVFKCGVPNGDEWYTVAPHKIITSTWGVFENNITQMDNYSNLMSACEMAAKFAVDRAIFIARHTA